MPGSNNDIEIISTAADGTQGNAPSGGNAGGGGDSYLGADSFSISPDGTKIAFTSEASNLVPGDDNGHADVFVKDLTTGAIALVSTVTGSAAGSSFLPAFSPDGTKVAFTTQDNGGGLDIYVKDLATGTTTLVDTDSKGARTRGATGPVFSPDGTKIAFTLLNVITPSGEFTVGGLYIEDVGTGKATLVSKFRDGVPGNVYSQQPTFSPDGTKIAFTGINDSGHQEIYVKDLITGAVSLVSTSATGQLGHLGFNDASQENTNPTFSPDGTKIAFQSISNDLVPGDDDGITDIFVKDLTTGAITRITTLANGTSEGGYGPAFSPDGTKIAFWTRANGYGGVYGSTSIYVKDLVTGAFSLISAPAGGKRAGEGDSYDPQFSQDGSKIVFFSNSDTLVTQDTNGTTADIFVKTLTTLPVDAAPVAVADHYSTVEGSALTIAASAGLLANDTDADGDALTAVLVTGPAHGALTFNADGSFTYTPAADYAGADAFTYKASDATKQSPATTVSLTVTALDHAPVAVNDSFSVLHGVGLVGSVLTNDTDPDVDTLTAVLKTGVKNGTLDLRADGTFTYTPNADFIGTDSFTYAASDGALTSTVATVTISVTDQKPVAVNDSFSVLHGVGLVGSVLTNDTDPDVDTLTAVLKTGVKNGTLDLRADGTFTYTPNAGFAGTDSFTYAASDGALTSNVATVTIGTGQPVTAKDDTYYIRPGIGGFGINYSAAIGVLANDTAPDGGLEVLGLVHNGQLFAEQDMGGGLVYSEGIGTADGDLLLFADGSFTYAPPEDPAFVGTDTYTYRVTDADGSTADATITFKIGIGTGQPVTAKDDTYSIRPGIGGFGINYSAAIGVLANDTAPDGGLEVLGLVYNGLFIAEQNGGGLAEGSGPAGGELFLKPDGSFAYAPPEDPAFVGTDTYTYRVTDADGSTADATITFKIGIGTGQPVTAKDDTYYIRPGIGGFGINYSAAIGVLANDTAPDGGLEVLGLVYNGLFIAEQNGGGLAEGSGPAGGELFLKPDGSFAYAPPLDPTFVGTDTFTYRVTDADGSTADATVTFKIGIGTGQPVTAKDDTYYILPGTDEIGINYSAAMGVLANDTAPDGGLEVLGLVHNGQFIAEQNSGGRVDAEGSGTAGGEILLFPDGSFSYAPPPDPTFVGTDTYTYRVTDADGSTADATITFKIGIGTGQPVTAKNDTYYIRPGIGGFGINYSAAIGVLANDTAPDGGLEVLGLVYNGLFIAEQNGGGLAEGSGPAGGELFLKPDGSFAYAPPEDATFVGTDTYTYRVTDADGSTADATVTFKIGIGTGQPVTAKDDTYYIRPGIGGFGINYSAAIGVLANDTAPDGGLEVLGLVYNGLFIAEQNGGGLAEGSGPAGGELFLKPDGSFAYAPPEDATFVGTDTFTYRVTDADGSIADATVTFKIGGETQSTKALPDGSTQTSIYQDGVLVEVTVTGIPGTFYDATDTVYDANQKPKSETFTKAGVLVATQTWDANGVRENRILAVVGKPYATQDAFYDAHDKLVSMTRIYADGSKAFSEITNADGSRTATSWTPDGAKQITDLDDKGATTRVETFNAAGQNIATTTFASDGSRAASTLDPATGAALSITTRNADKSSQIDNLAVVGKPYTEQIASYDAKGTITGLVRKYADHSTAFTQTSHPDGSGSVENYDTSGRKTTSIDFAADGSRDVFLRTYAGNDTTPATVEQDHYNTSNRKLSSDIVSANGSHKQTAFAADVTLSSHAKAADAFTSSGAGSDTFVFQPSFGQDLITNFHSGSALGFDTIQFDSSLVPDFAHLQSMMTTSGHDTLITVSPTDTLTLKGVTPTALVAQNFTFVAHHGPGA